MAATTSDVVTFPVILSPRLSAEWERIREQYDLTNHDMIRAAINLLRLHEEAARKGHRIILEDDQPGITVIDARLFG